MLSCMKPTTVTRPTKKAIGRIAENQPKLLNLLLAYFVFEWRSVRIGQPPHGVDQSGVAAMIPDYVQMWTDPWGSSGVDVAVHLLLASPEARTPTGPGYISEWLRRNT